MITDELNCFYRQKRTDNFSITLGKLYTSPGLLCCSAMKERKDMHVCLLQNAFDSIYYFPEGNCSVVGRN